jgi:phosphoglycolate phosphatase
MPTVKRGLVIFDMDGTLFNGASATVAAVQQAFEECGLRKPDGHDVLRHIGRPAHEFHDWLRSHSSAAEASKLVAAVDKYELELIDVKGELYPGVRDALVELRTLTGQMALCTNGPKIYVQRIFSAHGLQRFFDVVRHWQSEGDTKALMVRELLNKLDGRPAVVVGDRRNDIEAAHQNGLAAVAAMYGYGSEEELLNAEAAAACPSEIPGLIRALL